MIRLRNKKGEVLPLDEVGFVEICDLDGNVSCAIYPDLQNHIHIVTKVSPEAIRYENIFNVKFSKIVKLPPELFKEDVQSR